MTRHVKVLRVECEKCGAGPYSTATEHICSLMAPDKWHLFEPIDYMQRTHTDKSHPTPDEEGLVDWISLFSGSPYTCGFKHKTQAKKWFNKEELRNLHDAGFCIREYKVSENNHWGSSSTKQVLFTNTVATRVKTHSIKEFFSVNS